MEIFINRIKINIAYICLHLFLQGPDLPGVQYYCSCSVLQNHTRARFVLSEPKPSNTSRHSPIPFPAMGHIHRLLLSQTLVMKLSDQPVFFSLFNFLPHLRAISSILWHLASAVCLSKNHQL